MGIAGVSPSRAPKGNGVTVERKVWTPDAPVILEDEHLYGEVYPGRNPNDPKVVAFVCPYGCEGMRLDQPNGRVVHHYSCAYWWNEGKDETPFDVVQERVRVVETVRRAKPGDVIPFLPGSVDERLLTQLVERSR